MLCNAKSQLRSHLFILGLCSFADPYLGAKQSGWLATLYDVGAVIGKCVHDAYIMYVTLHTIGALNLRHQIIQLTQLTLTHPRGPADYYIGLYIGLFVTCTSSDLHDADSRSVLGDGGLGGHHGFLWAAPLFLGT